MNLRRQICIFTALVLTVFTVVGGICMYKFAESSIVSTNFDNLNQARIRKTQTLRTEFDRLSNSLISSANQTDPKQLVQELSSSKRDLFAWLKRQPSEKEWRAQLAKNYQSKNDPLTLKLINRLMVFPIYIQSQFALNNKDQNSALITLNPVQTKQNHRYFKVYNNAQKKLKELRDKNSLDDVVLIDATGSVIFSFKQNLDLGANLITGPLNSTKLSEAFRWTVMATPHTAKMFDFDRSMVSSFKPAAYLAAPLYDKSRFIGALVYQVSQERINSLLSDHEDWKENGLKETGEIIAFGPDGYLRNNSRALAQDPARFTKKIKSLINDPQVVKKVLDSQTTALNLSLPRDEVRQAIAQENLRTISEDYLGVESLWSSGRVLLPGGDQWVLAAKMEYQEVVRPLNQATKWISFLMLLLIAAVSTFAYWMAGRMIRPLNSLTEGFDELDQNQTTKKIEYEKSDELGSLVQRFNRFSETMEKTTVSKDFLDRVIQSINEYLFVAHSRYNPRTKKQYLSISSVNMAAAEILGVNPTNMIGTDLSQWLEGDFYGDSLELHKEGQLKSANGVLVPVEISCARITESPYGGQGLVIVCTDMRWKKDAEDKLRAKEVLLKESQTLTNAGAFYWDLVEEKGLITDEIFKVLGVSVSAEKKSIYEVLKSLTVSEDQQVLTQAFEQSHTRTAPFAIDIRINRENAYELTWIRCTARLEYDDYGNAQHMFGVIQDISALKRSEQDLIAAKDDALRSSQAKSEFLARMSHEIRTPMNAIMGMAELLRETKLNEDQVHYVQIFCKAGEVLMSLINDILDISKIEAGEVSIENIPFDLNKILNNIQDMMKPKIQEKNLELSVDVGPGVGSFLMGDPTKLQQIITNLVGNSLKFTEQGQIKVKVAKNPTQKDSMIISVSDSGLGIPAATQHLIFQKFSQTDSSITRKFGGTGLGLAISKSLVELMGGQMWFKSRESEGSTFFFSIPYREQNAFSGMALEIEEPKVGKPQKRVIEKGKDRKLRILVADDTEDNRTLFSHYLKNGSYEIVEACNGREALDRVKSDKFDIVFMDVQMPEMDGYAATVAIREWEKTNHKNPLPIVALTAHALSDDRQKSLRMGCNDHVTKPFKKDTLLSVINRYSL